MTLNEYKKEKGFTFKQLGDHLHASMWTVRRWCDEGKTVTLEGSYLKVVSPERVLHRARIK